MKEMNKKDVFAGVYVSADQLDCAVAGSSKALRCANSEDGLLQLIDFLGRYRVLRVGLGASGDGGAEVVDKLRVAGFEVIVYRPTRAPAPRSQNSRG